MQRRPLSRARRVPSPLRVGSLLTGGLALAAAVAVVGTLTADPALAAGSVAVSRTDDLDPAGQLITVTGSGFNEQQGIYVSVCVDNGPGQLATPCLGGVDTAGTSGSSAWVSSTPPPYAEGLTIPYGPGGTFEVTILALGADPKTGIDCRVVTCSLVTRSDHTATDDRSQDTRTPLTFLASATVAPSGGGPTVADEPDAVASTPTTSAPTSAAEPTPAEAGPSTPIATQNDDASGGVSGLVWIGGGVLAAVVATTFVITRRRTQKGSAQ
jgi:hypothetical protein